MGRLDYVLLIKANPPSFEGIISFTKQASLNFLLHQILNLADLLGALE